MKDEEIELVRGSGNVYRDFGDPNADVLQLRAILAAEIIKFMDREKLTVRAAQARTGIAAADFSRIRRSNLGRFTVDRLMTILNRLGSQVEVEIKVRAMDAQLQDDLEAGRMDAGIRRALAEQKAGNTREI